jgi:hypothetical protein
MSVNKPSKPKTEVGASPVSANKAPNCWDCRYLRITWNDRRPYGCQFMGFESRMLPCFEVLRADARPCGAFVAKPTNVLTSDAVNQSSPRQNSERRILAGGINIIT